MSAEQNKDMSILFARLDDLCGAAMQGELAATSFLSPRELHFSGRYLASRGMSSRFLSWGGFTGAERKRIFILPDYIENVSEYRELSSYGFDEHFSGVEVKGSGYRALSHRDFLGSVLGLGLERSVIGDIIVYEGEKPRAVIICDRVVASFICENLLRIGSDAVKVREISLSDIELPEKRFLHIADTVASPRLDGVISALISVSRERAKEIAQDGAVELDYEVCERPDKVVSGGSLLTVRGYGKFRINSLSQKTKKGRVRLDADKYV